MGGILIVMGGLVFFIALLLFVAVILVVGTVKGAEALVHHDNPTPRP